MDGLFVFSSVHFFLFLHLPGDAQTQVSRLLIDSEHHHEFLPLFIDRVIDKGSDALDEGAKGVGGVVEHGRSFLWRERLLSVVEQLFHGG